MQRVYYENHGALPGHAGCARVASDIRHAVARENVAAAGSTAGLPAPHAVAGGIHE